MPGLALRVRSSLQLQREARGEEPVPEGRKGKERRAESGAAGEGEKKGPPSRSGVPPSGVTPKPRTYSSKLLVAGARSVVHAGQNWTLLCQPSEWTAKEESNTACQRTLHEQQLYC
ncbi:hypothetical protein llap_231 [Limosa lapponica baueri]|uniref:Uncharacterized protein n=1 Tax=Limosa lapponica baueri TaxID=1758121 RepID=A0A2I0UU10_LIMLA|nr:hypothetical protein llap_231 [Limosa lapponica baueri]